MMNLNRLLIIISTLFFFYLYNLPSIEAQIDPSSKKFVTAIDSIFLDRSDLKAPGASVIIMKGDKLLLSKNYGSANLSIGIPFSEQTIFPLSDFTDHLVAFSILQLEKKQLISLNDPVNKYLPDLGFQKDVSIAHFLNHSSDLPALVSLRLIAGWTYDEPFYQKDFLNLTKKVTKDLKPDTRMNHSGAGIKILMMLVEKVTGVKFSEYAATNIFQPLGMTNTFVKNEDFMKNKNHSIGYDKTEKGYKSVHAMKFEILCPLTYSTQKDFQKWMLNFQTKEFEGSIIEQMDQALLLKGEFQKRKNRSFCFGQHQYYKFSGEDEFYLRATDEGYSWKWVRLKQSDYSIMTIGNLGTYIGAKVNDIARLLIPSTDDASDKEAPKTTPIKMSEKELEAYTGLYWDNNYFFSTQVSIKDGALYYNDLDNGWNFSLTQLSKSLFESPPWNKVEFSDLDGQKKLNLMLMDGREFPSEEYDPTVVDAKDYPKYAGIYTSDQLNNFYQLIVKDDQLILKRGRKPDLELTPIAKNKFRTSEADFRLIEFKEDDGNSIYQMKISNFMVRNVKFRRL